MIRRISAKRIEAIAQYAILLNALVQRRQMTLLGRDVVILSFRRLSMRNMDEVLQLTRQSLGMFLER